MPCVLRVKPSFISNLVHDIVSIYGPQLSRGASSSNFGIAAVTRRRAMRPVRGPRLLQLHSFKRSPWPSFPLSRSRSRSLASAGRQKPTAQQAVRARTHPPGCTVGTKRSLASCTALSQRAARSHRPLPQRVSGPTHCGCARRSARSSGRTPARNGAIMTGPRWTI